MFTGAIVRPPGPDFTRGLTTADLGAPVLEKALRQHERYCEALLQCGLTLTTLDPLPSHPDSTFVEDTAVLTDRCAILARPGAPSREGEVSATRRALSGFYSSLLEILPPGTLDGGDVCQIDNHFLIGISSRTNEEGARQLARLLARYEFTSACVEIRGVPSVLHLKSGLAYLGDNRLAAIDALADWEALRSFEVVRVEPGENYAANCVRVNERVLLAAGYPRLEAALRGRGHSIVTLEMSEFQKMDGGLSCLSLRF